MSDIEYLAARIGRLTVHAARFAVLSIWIIGWRARRPFVEYRRERKLAWMVARLNELEEIQSRRAAMPEEELVALEARLRRLWRNRKALRWVWTVDAWLARFVASFWPWPVDEDHFVRRSRARL